MKISSYYKLKEMKTIAMLIIARVFLEGNSRLIEAEPKKKNKGIMGQMKGVESDQISNFLSLLLDM